MVKKELLKLQKSIPHTLTSLPDIYNMRKAEKKKLELEAAQELALIEEKKKNLLKNIKADKVFKFLDVAKIESIEKPAPNSIDLLKIHPKSHPVDSLVNTYLSDYHISNINKYRPIQSGIRSEISPDDDYIILINSRRENFNQRNWIRDNWGKNLKNYFFMVGIDYCPFNFGIDNDGKVDEKINSKAFIYDCSLGLDQKIVDEYIKDPPPGWGLRLSQFGGHACRK